MGINPRLLGSLSQRRRENSKQLVRSHPISTRLILPRQQIWCQQTANNKWALTHVCQAHTTNNHNKRQQIEINLCLLHPSNLGFVVIDNKWASTHVCQTHTAATTTKDNKWESTHVYCIYPILVLQS